MRDVNTLITRTRDINPIPASPTREPVINIILKHDDGRRFYANFAAIYGAHKLLDFVISDRPTQWLDDNTLRISDKVTVTSDIKPDGLSQILEHEYTPKERAWDLPPIYMILSHKLFSAKEPQWTDAVTTDTPKSIVKPKKEKPEKAPKPTGLIGLPEIFPDIDAKLVRLALRKTNTPKPPHGRWEFPESEVNAIKSTVTTYLKKAKKI